ncbi:SDR family NAD(P)-dependent oxidoreductase [Actinomadura rayongensis]
MDGAERGTAVETDVAIIGMAGRFPGADDLDAFWRLLSEGREGISRFGRDELAAAGVPARLLDDPAFVPAHGVIPDVDLFDTGYFEFTPAEARITDPQHRVLLTAAHAALENAGYDPARHDGLIGVYAGAAINTYLQQQVLPAVDQTATSDHFAVMVGNDKDFLATRLAYKLDLRGPAYTVQTACSTSLVAIHLACQGLINGECDVALAGGVTVKFPQTKGYLYEEGAILSPDGRVRTFDAGAGGTVLGNGVGVLVLKPLRDALADRDTIHAVIKGTATNNDGAGKVSFAAPGAAGQAAVIREAHLVSGVDPRSIGHVEAHGTATRLGDPVEVSALTRAFREGTDDTGFCAIGSVKSNLGHLDAAAGVAGVIKTVLMMKHRTLVPTVNFATPNPAIDFPASPFTVSTRTAPWTASGPLRGGVSSFGIGGTNAHAVLEEAPAAEVAAPSRPTQVLVVSARTPSALGTAARLLADHLDGDDGASLADVAHTLAVGRRVHEYRLAVAGTARADLAAALRSAPVPDAPAAGGVSFVFTEDVPGAADLAAEWRAAEPAFAEHYDAALAAAPADWAAAFAVQYALGRLWLGWGLRPVAIHGVGLAAGAAAAVLGVLDLTDAARHEGAPLPDSALRGADDEVRGVALTVADGPWGAVARAWQAGAEVDWTAWFAGEARGRVPLPTYPFEGRRCWLDVPAEVPAGPGPHPMLAENVSTLDSFAYRTAWSGTEFYVADHRVGGEPVLPAAAFLELARAAGELATGGPVRLHDVSFDRLLSGPRAAQVALRRGPGAVAFEITDDGAVYASGSVSALGTVQLPDATPGTQAETVDHERCYALLREHDLDYGARMRALAEVALGDGEAWGTLRLPEGAALDGAVLNPALLDGALHALVVLLGRTYGGGARGFLPLALEELTVFAPVTGPCRVHVTVDQRGDRSARADLTLRDAAGTVLARLRGLAVRVLRRTDAVDLLVRRWDDAPAVPAETSAGPVLVIADDDRSDLATALSASEAAPGSDGPLTGIAAVVLDEPDPDLVLRVVRRLLHGRPTEPVRVVLLHRHDASGPLPERAALAGLARTVRAENPLLAVQVVGLAPGVDAAAALRAELAGDGRDAEVEHTASGRRVPRFVPADHTEPVAVRDGGVYLVTGGAGGLGRAVAGRLLERADATVVLVGRAATASGLDERVTYRSADVADPAALTALLADVRREFGPVTGVVHAAGVLRDGFVLTKSDADVAAVLAPKVSGVRALHAATADDPLDFFVAFSSIAAHIGSVGQADYAYANAFLEAFAERVPGLTAVAWPMWADGGMRQTADAAAEVAARTGFGVLPTAVGLDLFERVLGRPGAVVAAYGDTERIAATLGRPAPAAPVAPTAPAGSRADALGMLRLLIAGETGLDPDELGEDDTFDRHGIDSLMITKLNRELERRFGDLSKTLFFEYPTLGELADHFAGEHATAIAAPAPAAPRPPEVDDSAIAIIGVAGRYPMADDLDEFWTNLAEGRDCVTEIPADRWDADRWYDPDPASPGRAHTRWGGFLRDVDRFDPLFFGISPRQAELMDPQERLFLQTAWHVVEDAGYRRAELAGRPVGVYVGVMYGEYQFHGAVDVLRGGRPLTGSSFATIANRVSYVLNLTGPSLALDTMCSSSLTAIHLACESLRRGETEMAIAGGVNVSIHPYKYAFLSQGRFVSSDGRCRAFGADGDGYVPGEGVGAVLLKPYAQALADGDQIHGLILGSAVNHGARTNGFSVPSPRAQQRAVVDAMERAGVAPGEIGYIEAHGTGTSLGDPIEITGLTGAYAGDAAAPGRWPIGSVKSNIGHLESAAGIAGLTKVLLQFRHRTLVPSLHSAELNPNIDFARSPFRVQREREPWTGPRTAGLSSFGAGGSNAHLVLAEPPVAPARERVDEPVLFVLSARDEERLRAYAERAARFLEAGPASLADLCFTLQVGREAMDRRFAVRAVAADEIVAALRRFAATGERPDVPGDGPLGDLARRWLAGENVDWAALHASGPARRRVRAPLYPFAPERYWIPLDPDLDAPALHPLVDANESTVAGLRFRKRLSPSDPLFRDHVIDGRPVLPGSAVLEFVRAAADLAEPGVRHALRSVVWGTTIEPADGDLDLHVSFDSGFSFEVHSGPDRTVHARGTVAAAGAPGALDLAAVLRRTDVVRDRDGAYADYRAAGFAYGPEFQVIEEIRTGADEALVRLSPGGPAAVLDGALRACHWAGRTASPRAGELAVPFSLDAFDVHGDLADVRHAHARLLGEAGGVRCFDVSLCDETGRVLASVRDFAGRLLGAPAPEPGRPLLYEPCWTAVPAPASDSARRPLMLVGGDAALESALAATGEWTRVTAVRADEVADLGTDGLDLVFVPGDELDAACRTLTDLVLAARTAGRVRGVVLHAHEDGRERPEHAALAGFARSASVVAPRVELLTLALPAGTPPDGTAAALAAELRAAPRAAGLEVRRTARGDREVRGLRRTEATGPGRADLRDQGVYMITGGGGALGRTLAEYLARAHRARLVLIGRSAPDASWHARLADLGAEVFAPRADVTDADRLAAALAEARARFGALHGVFHLAGIADDGTLADADPERFARVLAPKTNGLLNLDRLTRDDPLDLFVVFSSIASVIGDFGAAAYATANRFADAFTVLRASQVAEGARRGRGLTLDWPLWAAGGVDDLVGADELAAYGRRSGMRPLTPEQGVAALELALAADGPWLVPAWGVPAQVDAALATPRPPAAPRRPAASGRRSQVVEYLRGTLSDVLKLPPGRLDSRVPLDDYGLDSVLVMESSSVLVRDFPDLRGTVFFEHRTVEELADHLVAEHADAVARLFPEAAPVERPAPEPVTRPVERAPERGTDPDEPIAVIGISGRYPGARDLAEFWDNLAAGRDSVTEVPADRWDAAALYDPDPSAPGRSHGRWGGFLDDVAAFDSLFFQISPAQARSMDPQERLFLETAWSALENAGYPPSRIPPPAFGGQGHDVGVFVGVMWGDYAVLAAAESARGNPQVVLANRSSIANQVSYFGDFRGPSVVVDTACSASLVAVHQACESLRRNECGYAIAGGVNVAVHPDRYVHLSAKTMLSSDGRCRAFGAGGDGYVPGEGVGAVVLKRLSEAVRDGDTVHAVIRASAVNHGGRTSGYTVPNPQAQQALVERTLAAAGVDARTIGCVEAHGTGTALGDPIEHSALAKAFAAHTSDVGFCALGSVKSAIGHLEGAAGIAGLTKAILQLKNGTLLPTLHADELNPVIDFGRSPFTVQRETAPWPAGDLPRRAAVSSFGAGGTNAHVILEEYRAAAPAEAATGPEALVLSARDEDRLRQYAADLGRELAAPGTRTLADVAHTLRTGREPMAERLAFVAGSLDEAAERFAAVGRGEDGQWLHRGRVGQHPPLAGLFTDGVGGEEFLTAQIRAGDDDLLCRLWVSGVAVDWDLVSGLRGGTRRRVPLPTYPFERVRHWLDTTAPDGPWTTVLRADDPVLADHVVQGTPILPGVGHLDLVARARSWTAVADVRWLAPLRGGGAVSVRFDGERYEVVADGSVRSTGRLAAAHPAPPRLDVAAIQARLDEGPDFYRALDAQGLAYGAFFRLVRRVWTGPGEALGRIETVADPAYALHPGVLDAALHTIAALFARRGPDAPPMLPFALDLVDVFGEVPTIGWSHVRETGPDRCDVLLADETGAVRVRFTGLTYRAAKPTAVPAHLPVWTPRRADAESARPRRVLLVGARLDTALAAGIAGAHADADLRSLPVPSGGLSESDLDRALAEAPDLVYFLGSAPDGEPADLRAVTDANVVALYRLVRALDRGGRTGLKVVTSDVHPLGGDEHAPWSAGLAGLAMVAGKEFPNLRVALVDVRSAEGAEPAAALAAEPLPAKTVPVSLRAGVRRVRSLRRIELPAGPSRFRRDGVYLVVGGLGVVGADTCRYLAREYGARLVIVGRSPLDDRRAATVAELQALGAQVRYLTADATDPAALRDALRTAKREFGALHGVVHAAMVLVNRPLRELPEAELRSALEAKADSAWSLLRAVADEPLDFVLFYSSGVAFEGNHGQAGYAAGCTFADALALGAARDVPFPVRVLNLGYWHAAGDPERERVLRRFEPAGIRPLSAERGMAVVERVLAGDQAQVLALDADRRILDDLGADPGPALVVLPGDVPPQPPVVGRAWTPSPELDGFQDAVAAAEDLATRLLAAVLDRLGLFRRLDRPAVWADLVAGLGIVPEQEPFFRSQLDALAETGWLRPVDGGWQRTARAVEPEAALVAALTDLAARRPDLAPATSLLRDCLTALPDVLTGRRSGMEVLFPGGSHERVAAVYAGDPVTDLCNAETAALVAEQVRTRLAAEPGRTVRILEVGAGTGGTSEAVFAALAPHAAHVEYVFTDLSGGFVRDGRARFGPGHPFARFEVLDIESDPAGQGFAPGGFDVVFGTNVFHATRRLAGTLAGAKRLLRRGGVLVLAEGTRPQHRLALVFGLTSGWWRFTDPEHRMPSSPLATERQWRDLLADAGFRDVSAAAPPTRSGPLFQSVIAAVSDGLVPATPAAQVAPAPAPARTARPADGAEGDELARVTAVFASVLEIPADRLDPDLTYENYGVDSLVALQLTRALEEVYGPQPATLLFERITIRKLAAHLRSEPEPPEEPAVAPVTEPAPSDDAERLVADLPDDVVDELLGELLARLGENGDRA